MSMYPKKDLSARYADILSKQNTEFGYTLKNTCPFFVKYSKAVGSEYRPKSFLLWSLQSGYAFYLYLEQMGMPKMSGVRISRSKGEEG